MANGEDKSEDLYAILGLNRECTTAELRNAYKKLALRWHPDRCSASGNKKFVEEAKKKFQAIQRAYSVLSDSNKRLLYDVGAYDSDDEDENGMGDFLNEMAVMMSQTKPSENCNESFEQLQELFVEMFQGDIEGLESTSKGSKSTSSSFMRFGESARSSNSSATSQMNYLGTQLDHASSSFDAHFHSFSLGVEQTREFKKGRGTRSGGVTGGGGSSSSNRCRHGRKQKGDEGVASR